MTNVRQTLPIVGPQIQRTARAEILTRRIVATVGGLGSVNIASLFPTSYALRECFILGVRYARIQTS